MIASRLLVALLMLIVCVNDTFAQQTKNRLSAKFTPLASRARVAAPIPGQWELHFTGSGIQEGQLEVTFELAGHRQHLVIPNLAVTGGENPPFRGMLPALGVPTVGYDDLLQATLTMRFVTTDGQTIKLDSQPLMIPLSSRRSFVIGLCDAEASGSSDSLRGLADALKFERFNPNAADKTLNTLIAHVSPTDMPEDPLGYCAFDLLLLADEAFAALEQKSLDAIFQWVRAGGSVCVLPGAALAPRHLSFLNNAAIIGDSDVIFVLDGDGRAAGGDDTFTLLRTGLGRTAIGPPSGQTRRDVAAPDWRVMSAFLWKITSDHREEITNTGAWRTDLIIPTEQHNLGQYAQLAENGIGNGVPTGKILPPTKPSVWSNEMVGQLMPKQFRFVPLWLIGLLLVAFVAAIGPLDYLVLGALKMRRMTWVLFPLTAFAFAFLTVWVANAYMGVSNETHSYEFLDIDDDGTLLRANRFELQFNGVAMEKQSNVSGGLFTAFDTSASPFSRSRSANDSPPQYQGRIPQGYGVTQDIAQWSPQLNRTFWIAPDEQIETPVKFPWNSLQTKDFETTDGRNTVRDRLLSPTALGPKASVYLFHEWKRERLAINPELMINPHGQSLPNQQPQGQSVTLPDGRRVTVSPNSGEIFILRDGRHMVCLPNGQLIATEAGQVPSWEGSDLPPSSWFGEYLIIKSCIRSPVGMFSLVSQVSPTGGWNFDDLAILDPTDPKQWLLVVVQPRGNDVVIYRKVYRNK